MSQDPLFSTFKRGNRETLAAVDRNGLLPSSSIPQPGSAMKRPSMVPRPSGLPRQSLAPTRSGSGLPRISSGGNLADLGGSAMKGSAGRRSFAPQSINRRSSTYQRGPSMGTALTPGGGAGIMGNFAGPTTNFFGSPASLALAQDPRPVRDKQFQAKVIQELTDFLQRNGYEQDCKMMLQQNTLRNPTAKDFTTIFKWLYSRLDPNYQWGKAFDQDVLAVLKYIRYPFAGNITKSQLAAIGSANSWPQFLAILHWMMQLVVTIDRFDTSDYDYACTEMGIEPETDRIMFDFFSGCYIQWLNNYDDFEEEKQRLEMAFEERGRHYSEHVKQLEEERAALKERLEALKRDGEEFENLEKNGRVLQDDIDKFATWLQSLEAKAEKLRNALEILGSQYEEKKVELTQMETERDELKESIKAQGLTPVDIDRMNAEQDKLNKSLQQVGERYVDTHRLLQDREAAAVAKLEELEREVSRFNQLGFKIGIVSSADESRNYDLRLFPMLPADAPESQKLISDKGVGYQPMELLSRDLRSEIRPVLQSLRKEVAQKIQESEEKCIGQQEKYERTVEALKDMEEEIGTLRARKNALEEEYNEVKETASAEATATNAQIEKLDRELLSIRLNINSGSLAVDQRNQAVKIEYDQLQHSANALREKFHGEVERMLNEIIKFKMHIQEGLVNYDAIVMADREELGLD